MAEWVYGGGTMEMEVEPLKRVHVFTRGTARVYKKVGFPHVPGDWRLIDSITDGSCSTEACEGKITIKVEVGGLGAWCTVF